MVFEIFYKDKANKFSNECEKIFDENNQDYIVYKKGISDHKNFNLLVATINNHAVGYQIIYRGGDFIKKEGYGEYSNKFHYEDDAVYIWDMCTKKDFENKGVQQALISFLINKYPDKNIYSLTDIENKASVHLQKKLGFEVIGSFDGHHNDKYHIYIHKPKN